MELELKVFVKGGFVRDREHRRNIKRWLKTVVKDVNNKFRNTMFRDIKFIAENDDTMWLLYTSGFQNIVVDKSSSSYDLVLDLDRCEIKFC